MIVIDPGHGGKRPGACAHGLREADIVLQVARRLADLLRSHGFPVRLTRTSDMHLAEGLNEDLQERCDLANAMGAELFVSLHCNATTSQAVSGIELFTTKGQTRADIAASHLFTALKNAFPHAKYRTDYADGDPDKEENFYVLRNTKAPAVLVELGFVTNPLEAKWLGDTSTWAHLAMSLCAGILAWRRP